LSKSLPMEDLNMKKKCNEIEMNLDPLHSLNSVSELDILRKAYELILENSDLFFKELGTAFTEQSEKGEFKPLI